MEKIEHVFIAMSGGVDSAVAASILLQEGFHVTGIHMETWKDPKWQAESALLTSSVTLAQQTADALGIPFIALDIRDHFFTAVVKKFIRQYSEGLTPNPCLFCNPQVKWGILQSYALEQGASYFATGHYARIEKLTSGMVRLLKGSDRTKDQSYVLSMLSQFQLSRSLLPLGLITKDEVRMAARKLNLPVAEREDSQDLCFLGNVDYRDFLQRFAPETPEPGEIVDIDGKVLGTHQGLAYYTIGQRKGIGIAAAEPYYVVGKDIDHNRLVVGFANRVGRNSLSANQASWIGNKPPHPGEVYEVMVRYRGKPASAVLTSVTQDDFRLEFKEELRGITPGQVAVLYRGDECLGGGVILASG